MIRLILPLVILLIAFAFLLYDYFTTKNKLTDDQIKSIIQANNIQQGK